MPISKWEVVLPQVLHSVRSLLCTTKNDTPHKRFFEFRRRSILGVSVPTWLSSPETVYVRKHARQSKFEPQVEKADLIYETPQYARVRFGSGREATVSLRDVAPSQIVVGQNLTKNKFLPIRTNAMTGIVKIMKIQTVQKKKLINRTLTSLQIKWINCQAKVLFMKKLILNLIPLAKMNLYCRDVLIALVNHLTDSPTIIDVLGGVNNLICARTKVTHLTG